MGILALAAFGLLAVLGSAEPLGPSTTATTKENNKPDVLFEADQELDDRNLVDARLEAIARRGTQTRDLSLKHAEVVNTAITLSDEKEDIVHNALEKGNDFDRETWKKVSDKSNATNLTTWAHYSPR